MKYIKNYIDFLIEGKIRDISDIKGESELSNNLRDKQNKEFKEDKKPIQYITLNKRINSKKVRFEIDYNDSEEHVFVDRIKRTDLKSISEFNEKLKYIVNELFPDKIDTDINVNGLYSIYLKNSNYTISFLIDYEKIKRGIYKLYVNTIITGLSNKGYIIELND